MGSGRHAGLLLPDDPDCPVHEFMTLLRASLVRDAALGPHHLLAVILNEHLLGARHSYSSHFTDVQLKHGECE